MLSKEDLNVFRRWFEDEPVNDISLTTDEIEMFLSEWKKELQSSYTMDANDRFEFLNN